MKEISVRVLDLEMQVDDMEVRLANLEQWYHHMAEQALATHEGEKGENATTSKV